VVHRERFSVLGARVEGAAGPQLLDKRVQVLVDSQFPHVEDLRTAAHRAVERPLPVVEAYIREQVLPARV
jgi:hypothetical protein